MYISSYIFREYPSEVGIFREGFLDTVDSAIYVALDHAGYFNRHLDSILVWRGR